MFYPDNTAAILTFMFPALVPNEDYAVYMDSNGTTLQWITATVPKPTPEEVVQQELPWRRWERKTDARSDIESYIDGAIQPVTRSMLRDGEPVIDGATGEAVREFIADCYAAVNAFDDEVDAATLETINTVAVDLPAYVGPQQ